MRRASYLCGFDLGGLLCPIIRRRLGRWRWSGIKPKSGADLSFDLSRQLRVVLEELLGVVAALSKPGLAVGEERARFLDQILLDAEVEKPALTGDPLPVLDVELGLTEGRRDFVLHHFDADPIADRLGAFFQRFDPTDV